MTMKGLGTGLPPRTLDMCQALFYVLYRNHLIDSFQQPSEELLLSFLFIKWENGGTGS